jgi:23S rRNA (uracil1939-C5)-methyltransferase
MEYRKNDVVTIQINDIGNDGEGIGKIDGYTLFVKDAVIGDFVEAKITKVKKNYGYARVERVITPSSFRVEPRCAYHRQCGGCQIQAMDYERQLLFKEQKIRNNLALKRRCLTRLWSRSSVWKTRGTIEIRRSFR